MACNHKESIGEFNGEIIRIVISFYQQNGKCYPTFRYLSIKYKLQPSSTASDCIRVYLEVTVPIITSSQILDDSVEKEHIF